MTEKKSNLILLFEDTTKRFVDFTKNATSPLYQRVAALEKRLADLEANQGSKYLGVYESGREYAPGDLVTRAGSMWYCWEKTSEAPGGNSTAWQLAVKRGRGA